MLSQELLEKYEEFIEQIENENRDEELEFAISSLREFVENEMDGYTGTPVQQFAYAVQCRLEEIWKLISEREKCNNPDLEMYFDEIMSEIEELSGYEAERASSVSHDDDDDGSDEYEDEEEDQ